MSLTARSSNALAASTWRSATSVVASVTSAAHTHFAHFAAAPAFNYATPATTANKAKYVKSGTWSTIG